MTKLLVLLLLTTLISCNDKKDSDDCGARTQAEEAGSTSNCTLTPVTGDTTGGTSTGGTETTGGGTSTGGTETTGGGTSTGGTTTGGTSTGGTSTGDTTGGLPNEAYTFDTNLKLFNFSATRQTKIYRAEDLVKLVIATEEFRSRVINHTYNGVRTYVDNGGFTNEQIYQKILDGAESLQPTKNNAMDVEVEIYTDTTSNTVGYTYSTSKRIWMNTKYFDQYTAASVSANLMHEWLHKLGFKHAVSYSTSRDYSVPYAIGRIMGDIARKNL